MEDIQIEPLRSMDDFLLDASRYQVPNFADTDDQWIQRVKANLIYYQTNYFLMSTAIFLGFWMLHPEPIKYDRTSISLTMAGGYNYFCRNQQLISDIKRKHPRISFLAILGGGYTIFLLVGFVMMLMFGFLLPVTVVLIHASLRLQNPMTKPTSTKELAITKSAMTVLIDKLGMKFKGNADKLLQIWHKLWEILKAVWPHGLKMSTPAKSRES